MTKTLRFWLNSRWRHVKLFPLTFKTEKPINPKKLERNTIKRASPSAHRSTEVFATQKRAAHIDGHDLAPGFDRKVGERHARWKNCRVVHQHFAATPRALDFFSSCNDRRLVTNVARNRQKHGSAFSRGFDHVQIEQHDSRTHASQYPYMAPPSPPPAPVTTATRPAKLFGEKLDDAISLTLVSCFPCVVECQPCAQAPTPSRTGAGLATSYFSERFSLSLRAARCCPAM